MENKVVVITGGTKGVGLALSEEFKKKNTVIVLSRRIIEDGKTAFACDVGNAERVKEVFDKIGAIYGNIDLLINNAGFGLSGATEFISDDAVDKLIKTNFYGVLNCVKYALPYMKKGSKIINVSSASALLPMPFRTLYSATKAGVMSLSDGLRLELYGTGIEVTCLCLGDVQTDFAEHRTIVKTTDARYGERIEKCDAFVSARGKEKKIPLEKVVKLCVKIADKKKTKPMYLTGLKYKMLRLFYTLSPRALQLKIINKIFG